jgi:site-specific DNA recombinase
MSEAMNKSALRARTRARMARRSTMRVAAYVRVSTSRQVRLQTIEQQLEMVRKYAREKGWELPEEDIFRDDGYSGTTLKRPALDALRDKARLREFEVIVMLSPDRLARNYVHQMVLIEEFEKGGCRVEFVERPMSSEPNDQLLLQIRGAVAEYERTLLSERMRRGRLAKYKAGLLLPWTHVPYGYRVDPDRPRDPAGVRPDEAKVAVVAEIFAAYLEPGASLFGVSRHLRDMGVPAPRGGKAWSTATLRGILTNPVYTGRVYAGRVRYRPARIRRSATHPIGHPHDSADPLPEEEWLFVAEVPAVVSQEQFDLAAQKLSKNKSFARRNNKANEHLLRALVSCGACMLACIACARTGRKNNDRKQRYYVCSGKFNKAHSTPEEKCPSRYAPAEQLDEIVWKDLCEVLTHPESITDALRRAHGGEWLPQELKARQENLRQGRAALGRQLERLTEAYLGEVIPLAEYQRRRKDLEQRDEALAAQERQLQAQSRQRMELAGVAGSIEDFCERVRGGLADATFEQKRKLVELLIDRVIVTDEEVEIRYVIPTDPSSEHVHFCHLRSDYLNHPAPRQHDEALRIRRRLPALWHPHPTPGTLDDLGAPAQDLLHPVRTFLLAVVAGVQPQMSHAREQLLGVLQEDLYAVAVEDAGRVDPRLEQQTLCIYENMAFAALYLLAPVVASLLSAHPGGLHRLGVHAARAGLGISPEADPQALSDRGVEPLEGAVDSPLSEVMVDFQGGKSWGSKRQAPPLLRT